jgi:predicted PurR-regulated permease PerM
MSETRTQAFWPWALVALAFVSAAWLMRPLLTGILLVFAGWLLAIFLMQLGKGVATSIGISYKWGYAVVVITLLSVATAAAFFMGSRIATQASVFLQEVGRASDQARDYLQQQGWWQQISDWGSRGRSLLAASQVASTAKSAASMTITALGGATLILFLGFYIGLQWDVYRRGMLALVPDRSTQRVAQVWDETVHRLWRWTLGRIIGMLVIGVGSGVGLWILGVPLPVTLGTIAGLSNFVPNVGPLISAIPAALFALQQGTDTVLYVAVLYLALQFVESYFLTPLIDQHQVSLPPGLILAMQLLLGILAGFLGLLLATPLTVVAYTAIRELYVKDVLKKTDGQAIEGA